MSECFEKFEFVYNKKTAGETTKILVDTESFVPNVPYHVRMTLISEKDTRTAYAEQVLIAKTGGPPRFALQCNVNCLRKFVPEQEGRILVNCKNCVPERNPQMEILKPDLDCLK